MPLAVFRGHGATRARSTTGRRLQLPEDNEKAIEASGNSARAAEVSGDSRKEVEASGDSDQEVATKVTGSTTKARSIWTVIWTVIKHLDSNLK